MMISRGGCPGLGKLTRRLPRSEGERERAMIWFGRQRRGDDVLLHSNVLNSAVIRSWATPHGDL